MTLITRQRIRYIVADFFAVNIAWALFNIVRYYTLPINYPTLTIEHYFSMPMILLGQLIFPIMVVLFYALSGFYNKVFFKSRLEDFLNAAGISALSAVIIFFTTLFNDTINDRMENIEMITILWLLFTVLTAIPRYIITQNAAAKIWKREIAFNALIIGTSGAAINLANDLEHKYRTMGLRVCGFISGVFNDNKDHNASNDLQVNDISELDEIIKSQNIDALIIADNSGNGAKMAELINLLLPKGLKIYLTPDIYHYLTTKPRTSAVAGHVLIDISQASISEGTRNIKRLVDIIGSSLAIIVLTPVYALLAVLIKRDSKGPILYRQERIGYNKRPFKIIKFRTMTVDAESDGPALSSIEDPRITKIGHWLRKYRLDELPQFWNVLKGEMSIVGPRPERQYYLKQIMERAPYYSLLHQVRPGITSWGMVKYGYASTVDQMIERMKYDLIYLENISLTVDLKILFYTINTILTGKGI